MIGGYVGQKWNQVKSAGGALRGSKGLGAFGSGPGNIFNALSKIDTGDLAEKVGLGRFKAMMPGIDETRWTDTTRSDAAMKRLEGDRASMKQKQFQAASMPGVGAASTMQAATLSPAEEMLAAQLADAERIRAAQLDPTQQDQFRLRQKNLATALQAQAAGQGPSLAAQTMDDARQANIAQAMALSASQRGLGAGQGLRQIQDAAADASQQAARDAMRGRIAEQLAARQQLSGVLQGARSQDIGLAQSDAQLAQQAALANQAAGNQFALQQGAMEQQAGLANQQAMNQFALQQAALQQDASSRNMAAQNQRDQLLANLQNQTRLANMQGQLQFQGQQDQFLNQLNQQLAALGMAQQGSQQDLERMKLQAALSVQGLNAQGFNNQQNAITGFLGGLAGAGAKIASS